MRSPFAKSVTDLPPCRLTTIVRGWLAMAVGTVAMAGLAATVEVSAAMTLAASDAITSSARAGPARPVTSAPVRPRAAMQVR